ncbi:unnamed protein product, partial [Prorocentrum cordatum]
APRAALPLLPATTGGSVRKEEEAGGGAGRRKGRGGGGAGPRAQSSAFLAARPASAEAASSKTGRPPGRSPGFASRACGASRSSRATSSAVRMGLGQERRACCTSTGPEIDVAADPRRGHRLRDHHGILGDEKVEHHLRGGQPRLRRDLRDQRAGHAVQLLCVQRRIPQRRVSDQRHPPVLHGPPQLWLVPEHV